MECSDFASFEAGGREGRCEPPTEVQGRGQYFQ